MKGELGPKALQGATAAKGCNTARPPELPLPRYKENEYALRVLSDLLWVALRALSFEKYRAAADGISPQ